MKRLSDFKINFKGLKQGIHYFEFDVDNVFFEEFDCFEFKNPTIAVGLALEKQSTILMLTFDFLGTFTVPCDRCLDDVEIEVSGEEKLIVKFGNEAYEDTDEIIMLPIHEHEINVASYIYEFILVNIPQKKVHNKKFCNQNVIAKLEEAALATEKKDKEAIEVDSRWAALKNIKLNKNK